MGGEDNYPLLVEWRKVEEVVQHLNALHLTVEKLVGMIFPGHPELVSGSDGWH